MIYSNEDMLRAIKDAFEAGWDSCRNNASFAVKLQVKRG